MKILKLNIIIVCIFIFLQIGNRVYAQDYPIKIIMEPFPPYNYVKDGKVTGFATEIILKIMSDLGVNYEINQYPDARVHSMLQSHKGIMAYVLFRTTEREKKYKWIGPIATDHIHLYKRKGSKLKVNSIEDVKNSNIAAFHRGVVFDRLKELGFKKIDKSPSVDSIFKKILFGRVNFMVGLPDLGVVHWLKLNDHPQNALLKTKVRIETYDMYIVCTKDIPDSIVNKWQKSLDKIKASGEFDRVLNSYK
ncbi:MAG: ABC transporter substrate-binding protein [Deltaproteobacteria bacterium]|nr:ABC transporter substrate-binding protein [Deltaproteobacteria bacterium]